MIKYIKKKKEKGMEILIDSYRGIITSVVRKHLGVLVNYEEECVDDVLLSIWNNIKSFDSTKNLIHIILKLFQNNLELLQEILISYILRPNCCNIQNSPDY